MNFDEKKYLSILKVCYRNGGSDVVVYCSEDQNIDDMFKKIMDGQFLLANKLKDYHPIMINVFDIRSMEDVSKEKRYHKWVL